MPDHDDFWSTTDFAYTCLRDHERTATLAAVIAATVGPGDVVLDAGAGTGILALHAARAGARKVYAVEVDPVLCRYLRTTVHRNGFDDVIEVVQADVHDFEAPTVDVALVELIETALVDESLVSAYNALVANGTVASSTRCLPSRYTTVVQPVATQDEIDGFVVVALRHDWSHYALEPTVWEPAPWRPTGAPAPIWAADFAGEPVAPTVRARVEVPDLATNGLRLTGQMVMPDGRLLGDFPSLNGPKIVPLPTRPPGSTAVQLHYELSGGFRAFELTWLSAGAEPGATRSTGTPGAVPAA